MTPLEADIPALLFHLKNCPVDFLQASVKAHALLADVYRYVYGDRTVLDTELPKLRTTNKTWEEDKLSIQIGCWFFSHPFFANKKELLPGIELFLFDELQKLTLYVKHTEWIQDEDRSEEFVRLALQTCGLLPVGESEAEATDRLDSLSTLKRRNVLAESNAAMEKIKEIKKKMAEDKAREAANVYNRE